MPNLQYVDADFVRVRKSTEAKSEIIFLLYFGDVITLEPAGNGWSKVTAINRSFENGDPISGFVKGTVSLRDKPILKVSMVDVQQGDGMVVEAPSGKIVLIDGGDNKLFARHIAARFRARKTTADNPLSIESIIITHGDADHFLGLTEIKESETLTGSRFHKRIFIHPKRILHNGLVKGPSNLNDDQIFGETIQDTNGELYVSNLVEDIRNVPPQQLNQPFATWKKTVDHWAQRGPIEMKRVGLDKNSNQLFDFFDEDEIKIELHSPSPKTITNGAGVTKKGLKFLTEPPKSAILHELEGVTPGKRSASHTINGHSIAFRLVYKNVRFLFTGDLNKESMAELNRRFSAGDLDAEVLKTPHHGSADFDLGFLKKVRPVVSLVSSGDESARKEYIHPRATLMNALGAASRNSTGILFSTELAAFFAYQQESYTRRALRTFFENEDKTTYTKAELIDLFSGIAEGTSHREPAYFDGFERTQFGMIEIRTDGSRVLIFTHSGKDNVLEAYRFEVSRSGNNRRIVKFADDVKTEG